MKKKILAVFAHPDDESFGPGGTLALYAKQAVEIHLLCATRGEAGKWQGSVWKKGNIDQIREKELLAAAKILGIKKVEFLGFKDGFLSNAYYHQIADKIGKKIHDFQPQIVLTSERLGISGHLDHIAVSMITTYAFLKNRTAQKLYYHCLPKRLREKRMTNYFVYFPEGYSEEEITTRIDYASVWQKKMQAMMAHKSQWKDVAALISRFAKWPKKDNFILQYNFGVKATFPETDLFAGIK